MNWIIDRISEREKFSKIFSKERSPSINENVSILWNRRLFDYLIKWIYIITILESNKIIINRLNSFQIL